MSLWDDLFDPDRDGLSGVFGPPAANGNCNTVGIKVNSNTVGTDPTSVYPYNPSRDSVVRSPAFQERERSLIDGEINSFDWEQEYSGKGLEVPPTGKTCLHPDSLPILKRVEGCGAR